MDRRRDSTIACTLAALGCAAVAIPTSAWSPGPGVTSAPGVALIAYQGDGAIHTVWPDGTHDQALRDIPSGARHMDWSPDGSQLVYELDDPEEITGDIWVADADGSDARILADCQVPCSTFDGPAWSPDGRSVAYFRYDAPDGHFPGSTVEILDLETGLVTSVAPTTTPEFIGDVRWSPDARRLVVGIQTYIDPDHSNDISASRLAIVDLNGDPQVVTPIDSVGFATYPDWHPHGDRILFQAGKPNPEWMRDQLFDLYTVRPDGTDLVRLTELGEDDPVVWMPTWGADGASILVTLTDRSSGDHTLGRLLLGGGAPERLPGPIYGAHPRQARTAPDP